MRIVLNGQGVDVDEGVSIGGLLAQKKINRDTVVIEYNDELVKRNLWSGIILQEGDRLEVLQFVGGG